MKSHEGKKNLKIFYIIVVAVVYVLSYAIGHISVLKWLDGSSFTICPFKNLFHISCPGCGLGRGFIAIFKGDFISALQYNPLSLLIFFFSLFFILYSFLSIIYKPISVQISDSAKNKIYKISTIILIGIWIYRIW